MWKNRILNASLIIAVALVIFIVLFSLLFNGILDEFAGNTIKVSGIYIIVALSLNLITGYTGQLSLGHAGFMAIGAYTTAICIMRLNMPIAAALLIGGILTAIFGFLIGFPTLRLRGDYLAITTLGFGEIVRVIMVNLESITGGAAGLYGVPSFSEDYVWNPIIGFVWIFVVAVITIVIISNLINSSQGRAIISIKEDEIASNSMGVNVPYYKMFSFVFSSFIAGVGGGLYALNYGYLNPLMFNFQFSVNLIVVVVLGGLGSITGSILASCMFVFFTQMFLPLFKDFALDTFGLSILDFNQVIFALVLILMMLFRPKGLMGTNEISFVKLFSKLTKRQAGEI
mgnify:CR=1 FL=1